MQSFLTFERVGSAEVQRGVRGAGAPRGRSVGGSLFERRPPHFLSVGNSKFEKPLRRGKIKTNDVKEIAIWSLVRESLTCVK